MVLKGSIKIKTKNKTILGFHSIKVLSECKSTIYQLQWYIVAEAILKWLERQYIWRGNSTSSRDNSFCIFFKGMAG